ncbi:MAG: tetratricopeptide repeat protein, partial [Fluviibacter sp.]
PAYQRSLAIKEKVFGLEHLEVALALNNLAFFYQNQNRLSEAEPLYLRSLAIM